jgi:hypothetical protein
MKRADKEKAEKEAKEEELRKAEKNEKERQRYQANKSKILKAKKESKKAIAERECEKRQLPLFLAPHISFLVPKGEKKDRIALHFGSREELLDFIIIIFKSGLTKEKVTQMLYLEEKKQSEKKDEEKTN